MIYNVYCIKDTKVGFLSPYLQPNDAVAIRDFTTVINNEGTGVSINYTDMELYKIGTFDLNTGILTSDVHYLIKGVDVKRIGVDVE